MLAWWRVRNKRGKGRNAIKDMPSSKLALRASRARSSWGNAEGRIEYVLANIFFKVSHSKYLQL
jgi:hypothetical protein